MSKWARALTASRSGLRRPLRLVLPAARNVNIVSTRTERRGAIPRGRAPPAPGAPEERAKRPPVNVFHFVPEQLRKGSSASSGQRSRSVPTLIVCVSRRLSTNRPPWAR